MLFLLSGHILMLSGAVEVRNAALSNQNGRLILTGKIDGNWKNALLEIALFDGKSGKYIPLPPPVIKEADQLISLEYTVDDLQWKLTFSPRRRVILGESFLLDRSGKERFLEVIFSLTPDWQKSKLMLWDGFNSSRPVENEVIGRKGIKGAVLKHVASSAVAFAATALFDEKTAVSLGHVTFDPVSYTAVEYDPASGRYSYSQRLVLSEGKTVPLRHVIAVADSSYGAPEGVIQQHYDSFPEVWSVVGGQENPYAWGNCAHYRNWWSKPRPEESRRLQYTHEWAYAPYFRAGDMLMREDLWDYTPDNPVKDQNRPKFGGVTINYKRTGRDEFLRIRKENFLKYGKRYGWMFYNNCSGVWCERLLAEKYYPDSLVKDKSVVTLIKGWSTGHDWEVRVFPMGTSWAKAFESDMKILADDLDLAGFALDCGGAGAYYRGEAVKKPLPGRAWDAEGIFIDQGVAVNHVVDFIHSLRPAPDQLTVHNNGCQKGDICMLERPFLNVAAHRSMNPLYRWFIGPRPGNVHGHGFLFKEMMPDWRNRTQEEFIDLIGRLSDYQIMSQFKWGLNQTFVTFYGNPQQVYIIPESLELIRAGWQSSVPVKLSPGFYVPYSSRYGRAENTFFFFGNTSKKESCGVLSIDNSELTDDGKERFIFLRKMRKEAETVNRIEGKYTNIDAVLPSRVPVLYETVAGVIDAPANFKAFVSGSKKLEEQKFTIRLDGDKFTGSLAVRFIRNWALAEVTVDGKTVAFDLRDGRYLTSRTEFNGNSQITLKYRSAYFNLPEDKIVNFPYVNASGKVKFRLHVPAGNDEALAFTGRFTEYFDFCRKKGILPEGTPPPVSRNANSLNRADVISLQIVPEAAAVIEQLPGGGILIRAKNSRQMEEMVRLFANVMDIRFPYIFKFSGSMGIYDEQLNFFRMNGKYIPERRYFE